jgi:hypothetical protein
VKLLKVQDGRLVFHIGKLELRMFGLVLRCYPVLPPEHFRLTGTARQQLSEHQKLLDEFMAAHREENRRHVREFLDKKDRFKAEKRGLRFLLSGEELEWLLQVLNDIRVGSWLQLGSPDQEQSRRLEVTPETAPHLWALNVAGQFQMTLVEAAQMRSRVPEVKARPAPKKPKPRRRRRGPESN